MDLSFFVQMAWKSALIAGAALGLAYVLRSRAASDRAMVLRIGVTMLLLLPIAALVLPSLQIEAFSAPEVPAASAAAAPAIAPELATTHYGPGPEVQLPDALAAAPEPAAATSIWDDPTPLGSAVAKALAGRSARTVARHCQQVLAGIGFTTEHDLHLYVRRVLVLDRVLGDARSLTRRLGEQLLADRSVPAILPL